MCYVRTMVSSTFMDFGKKHHHISEMSEIYSLKNKI